MAYHGQARDPVQHHAFALAPRITGTEPRGKHMAVHARQLVVQPGFQIIRRYRRPELRGLEQPHRSGLENHVHRSQEMGPRVLINAGWYWIIYAGRANRRISAVPNAAPIFYGRFKPLYERARGCL